MEGFWFCYGADYCDCKYNFRYIAGKFSEIILLLLAFKTTIYGGFKDIKGIWTFTKIMTETPRKGSKTLMQYDNVDYNIGLSDSLFEQSNLKR